MISVRVTKDVRKQLQDIQTDERSVDAVINNLLDTVEESLNESEDTLEYTNINLHPETMERLKSFQSYDGEGYNRIINRALSLYND